MADNKIFSELNDAHQIEGLTDMEEIDDQEDYLTMLDGPWNPSDIRAEELYKIIKKIWEKLLQQEKEIKDLRKMLKSMTDDGK